MPAASLIAVSRQEWRNVQAELKALRKVVQATEKYRADLPEEIVFALQDLEDDNPRE